jgi:hypothetical protein
VPVFYSVQAKLAKLPAACAQRSQACQRDLSSCAWIRLVWHMNGARFLLCASEAAGRSQRSSGLHQLRGTTQGGHVPCTRHITSSSQQTRSSQIQMSPHAIRVLPAWGPTCIHEERVCRDELVMLWVRSTPSSVVPRSWCRPPGSSRCFCRRRAGALARVERTGRHIK